jgi:DNA-binding MarR family transcriptional regulator
MAAKPLAKLPAAAPVGAALGETAGAGNESSRQAPNLDQIIHERVRLGIVSALATTTKLSFGELKEILGLTDGNLSIHARKLEDAGYIECRKFFEGRRPQTEFELTPTGRKALEKYINHMEALIEAMKPRQNPVASVEKQKV